MLQLAGDGDDRLLYPDHDAVTVDQVIATLRVTVMIKVDCRDVKSGQ